MYREVRSFYWQLCKPHMYAGLSRDRARLATLVPAGSLAFDIGANIGDVTSLLLDIGVKPIAVEPNDKVARVLERRYHVPGECAAVGAGPGEAILHLGRQAGHSTLSDEWHDLHRERWVEAVTVPVTTLDELIARYGMPKYVKIDVEGYEAEVLRGLSHAVDVISFEFQCSYLGATVGALARLDELGDYRFRFADEDENGFSDLSPEIESADRRAKALRDHPTASTPPRSSRTGTCTRFATAPDRRPHPSRSCRDVTLSTEHLRRSCRSIPMPERPSSQ